MNAALAYVEDNLTGEIDYKTLAGIACCSSQNFFRMFSFITDVSLSEYIRRRRLTQAALELQNSGIKVIDLALRYGYDSPVSFSRAFHALHGVTPSEARAEGVKLKAYPRLSFQISIKGEKEMDYRIESKEAFQVFGIEGIFKDEAGLATAFDTSKNENLRMPSHLWDESHENGAYEKLAKDAGTLPAFVNSSLCKVHGICHYKETEEGTFPYMLCALRGLGSNAEGYTIADIPAHTWAIFPTGKFDWDDCGAVLGGLYKRIFSEWMPTSGYEQVGSLDMELYGGDDEQGYIEIWLAVRKV